MLKSDLRLLGEKNSHEKKPKGICFSYIEVKNALLFLTQMGYFNDVKLLIFLNAITLSS